MSQENVEIVRSIYAGWEHGDFSSSDWAHPEIEWVMADGPTATTRTGVAGMNEGWRENVNAWTNVRAEAEEYRQLDDGRVLVFFHVIARGKASGLELPEAMTKGASLYEFRDGKVTRLVNYWDRQRALEAAGLRE